MRCGDTCGGAEGCGVAGGRWPRQLEAQRRPGKGDGGLGAAEGARDGQLHLLGHIHMPPFAACMAAQTTSSANMQAVQDM